MSLDASDPLARARELTALRSLRSSPDAASSFGYANLPRDRTIHVDAEEKSWFADLLREMERVAGRQVTHAEAFRWVRAVAEPGAAALVAEFGAAARRRGS